MAPKGQGGIPVEDLRRAIAAMKENDMELIAAATGSPFKQEVLEARLLEGFKLPAIKAYDGKSNPQYHLDHFNDLMELHLVLELAKMQSFYYHPNRGCQEVVQVHLCWNSHHLATTEHFIPPIFPSNQEDNYPFSTPRKCKTKEKRNLKVVRQLF